MSRRLAPGAREARTLPVCRRAEDQTGPSVLHEHLSYPYGAPLSVECRQTLTYARTVWVIVTVQEQPSCVVTSMYPVFSSG